MLNIVLYQPRIPPNTGNIARLCVATNSMLHLIRPIAFFLDDKSMKRAGCDYWSYLKLECHNSLEELMSTNRESNFYYVTKKGERSYTDVSYQDNDYLVFGSEDDGLPDDILSKNSNKTISIPMPGPTRSLNLSNSVAIVMYEAIRQR